MQAIAYAGLQWIARISFKVFAAIKHQVQQIRSFLLKCENETLSYTPVSTLVLRVLTNVS